MPNTGGSATFCGCNGRKMQTGRGIHRDVTEWLWARYTPFGVGLRGWKNVSSPLKYSNGPTLMRVVRWKLAPYSPAMGQIWPGIRGDCDEYDGPCCLRDSSVYFLGTLGWDYAAKALLKMTAERIETGPQEIHHWDDTSSSKSRKCLWHSCPVMLSWSCVRRRSVQR